MKKVALVLVVLFLVNLTACACAETDLSAMTLEELYSLRAEVNNEIASRNHESLIVQEGTTIADLFPDTWIARHIRDELGKFSTKDVVTQEELDTIRSFYVSGQTVDQIQVTTLEGLQYLRNLTSLDIVEQDNIFEIPEWVGNLTKLTNLRFMYCPVKTIPDCVCNLTSLKTLDFYGSDIESLPDDIGNLENLKTLNIAHTKITELPASIYNLSLNTFNREGLDID